jgi:hypothetical protein
MTTKSSGEVTPVGSLSTVVTTVEGLRDGLSGPFGEVLDPISQVCQEEVSASNGSYSFFVGELESLGKFCALAVTRRSLEEAWPIKLLPRAPNGLGPIACRYRGWQRAELEEWGEFVLLGEEQVVIVARAAPPCLANDIEGRKIRVTQTQRLSDLGIEPCPRHMWECEHFITPTACDYQVLTLDE